MVHNSQQGEIFDSEVISSRKWNEYYLQLFFWAYGAYGPYRTYVPWVPLGAYDGEREATGST